MLLNGKAPLPGQVVQLPTLAQTMREVADHGKDGFYRGRVAEAIVELVQSKGGLMDLDDLANHSTSFVEPIKYTYANEVTVYEVSIFNFLLALFSHDYFRTSALLMDKVRSKIYHAGLTKLF